MYDISGRKINCEWKETGEQTYGLSINPEVPGGLFFIRLEFENGMVSTFKVIKD